MTITERFINRYVNYFLVIKMSIKKESHIEKGLSDKDEYILNEIKRIKKMQAKLYKEYEIQEVEED